MSGCIHVVFSALLLLITSLIIFTIDIFIINPSVGGGLL